ncbi:ABC transporter permease [Glutamicibacter arilaitensis]|uniref:ABC transporter permease n=1 Tax=Glutamicibacter arilaitensis TaxID=256701 RepID=UPI003A9442C3
MKIYKVLIHGLNDLRANRLRHLLVGLSMLLGVLAISAVSSADQLVTKYLVAEQEQLHGKAQTYVSVLAPGSLDQEEVADSFQRLSKVVENIGGNALFSVRTAISVPHVGEQNFERVAYQGDYAATYRVPLSVGTWPRDNGTVAVGVVLNEYAADLLGIDETPQSIEMNTSRGTKNVVVTGIAQDGLKGGEARIYQPLGSSGDSSLLLDEPIELMLTAPGDKQDSLQRYATGILEQSGTSTGESMEFMRQDTVDNTKNSVAVTKTAFLVACVITLLVAAVGVLNVGLATVGERSEELVIRRALGATKKQVFGLVMGSSLLIGVIVAVIAAALVLLASAFVVPKFMDTAGIVQGIDLPIEALWFGLAAALLTSFLGALSPAIKATKLDVAQALRS